MASPQSAISSYIKANIKSKADTKSKTVLVMALMLLVIIFLTGLSVYYQRINVQLRADVDRLSSTQVVLMVPDEQAQVIADWLVTHPEQTQAMLKMVAPGEHKVLTLGPEIPAAPKLQIPPLLEKAPETDKQTLSSPSTESVKLVEATEHLSTEHSITEHSITEHLSTEHLSTEHLMADPLQHDASMSTSQGATLVPVVISQHANGVKIISLPNGGIRVTTRDGK